MQSSLTCPSIILLLKTKELTIKQSLKKKVIGSQEILFRWLIASVCIACLGLSTLYYSQASTQSAGSKGQSNQSTKAVSGSPQKSKLPAQQKSGEASGTNVAILIKRLGAPDLAVAVNAKNQLVRIGKSAVVRLLKELGGSFASEKEIERSIERAEMLGQRRIVDEMMAKSAINARVIAYCLSALGDIGDKNAIEPLKQMNDITPDMYKEKVNKVIKLLQKE